jgi:hypothetical protein
LDFIVICCGGGGIPVIREGRAFSGVDAVIDKDLVSALLAEEVGVDIFLIATDVSGVMINFGRPDEKLLQQCTLKEAMPHIAKGQETVALKHDYLIEHNLYPNVDFYSGIVLQAVGIPPNMFKVMCAIGRLPGWFAQWKESREDPNWKLCRPRQIDIGPYHA